MAHSEVLSNAVAKKAGISPFDAYQRLGGEAEARLVQSRIDMFPKERLQTYPWNKSYFKKETGTDIGDLIFLEKGKK